MVTRPEPIAQDSDLIAHEQTYHVFNVLVRWSMVVLATLIASLTVWFATPGGFAGGAVVAIVVFVIGYLMLVRHEEQQPLDPWAEGR